MPSSLTRAWPKIARVSLLVVMLALVAIAPAPALAEGPNLLQNPGFEPPFTASIPGKENCLIAAPWVAWYVEGSKEEVMQGYKLAPEYKMAIRADYPGNRVRNGELSQQYFHSFGNFQAGVLQVVNNVTPGARYKYEQWAMTWSCSDERTGLCDGATSGGPSPMHLRIGVDPTGGTDPFNPAIVWSPENNAYDNWTHFEVVAVAQRSTVTVFVYSYPDYRSQDNNVYLDDASLTVMAPPPTATPKPTNTPLPTPKPTNTPLPTATPKSTNTPPPTNTPLPTATLAATNKPLPTNTPVPTPTLTPTPVSLLGKLTSGTGLIVSLAGLVLIIGVSAGVVLSRRH